MTLVIVGVLLLILAAILSLTGIGFILGVPIGVIGLLLIFIAMLKGGIGAVTRLVRRPASTS